MLFFFAVSSQFCRVIFFFYFFCWPLQGFCRYSVCFTVLSLLKWDLLQKNKIIGAAWLFSGPCCICNEKNICVDKMESSQVKTLFLLFIKFVHSRSQQPQPLECQLILLSPHQIHHRFHLSSTWLISDLFVPLAAASSFTLKTSLNSFHSQWWLLLLSFTLTFAELLLNLLKH